MSVGDIGLALRAMGALVTGKEIEIFAKKYDGDRTGKIGVDDYINMLAEIQWQPDNEDDIKAAFSPFDKNGEEMLSLDEMQHVLSRIGDTLTPEEAANFIGMIDSYGDGHARMSDIVQTVSAAPQQAINKQLNSG